MIVSFRKKKQQNIQELISIIGPIIRDRNFRKLCHHRHHLFFSRFEHLLHVSMIANRLAKIVRADVRTCTLAGILHDYHFTRYHSYQHGIIAAENAKRFTVDDEVLSIIKSHMYPLGRKKMNRASGKNFWVIKAADTIAACLEFFHSFTRLSFRYRKVKMKKTRRVLSQVFDEDVVASERGLLKKEK